VPKKKIHKNLIERVKNGLDGRRKIIIERINCRIKVHTSDALCVIVTLLYFLVTAIKD